MGHRQNLPWMGLLLASATAIGLLAQGINFWLVGAVFLIWIGTLWLAAAKPPPPSPSTPESPFSRASMNELIEYSGTPILLTEKNRITAASRTARAVLGSHVLGQDVKVALRHPEAIALLERGRSGSAVIHGLARRRDIWRMSRQSMGGGVAVIELINQTSEADISRAHTDFVANASHELRTPLASIIGYVETLQDDDAALDPSTAKKFLDTIQREAKRLQNLVSDLMSLSRVEAEKHDQPVDKVTLRPLVERAARDAAGQGRLDRLDLQMGQDITIRGDAQQLEQLVRNLVDNALKYGAEDSKVTVVLETGPAGEANLCVIDRGEGIAPEHLPHLTRRFYRTDPGRSRASGGTGLGLAIVKHIVERHRGRLDIRSKLGQGTTVSVRIPPTATPEE